MFITLAFVSVKVFPQQIGDYRTVSTGYWSTLSNWQRFNGTLWRVPTATEGYPGQYTNTRQPTVAIEHNVQTNTLLTQDLFSIRKLSISSSATLTIIQRGLNISDTLLIDQGATLILKSPGASTLDGVTLIKGSLSINKPSSGTLGIIRFGNTVVVMAGGVLDSSPIVTPGRVIFRRGLRTTAPASVSLGHITFDDSQSYLEGNAQVSLKYAEVRAHVEVINNITDTVVVGGNLSGNGAWRQGNDAILLLTHVDSLRQTSFTPVTLRAHNTNNTVVLQGRQGILYPTDSGYYGLTFRVQSIALTKPLAVHHLRVATGCTFNLSNYSLTVTGDWINLGTVSADAATLYLSGKHVQRIQNVQRLRLGQLVINNTGNQSPHLYIQDTTGLQVNRLTLQRGCVDLNNTTLSINSATPQDLQVQQGWLCRGRLMRAVPDSVITESSPLVFPVGSTQRIYPFYVTAPAGTTGGQLTLSYESLGTNVAVTSTTDTDGSIIRYRQESYWEMNSTSVSGELTIQAEGASMSDVALSLQDIRLLSSIPSGSHLAATGSLAQPMAQRQRVAGTGRQRFYVASTADINHPLPVYIHTWRAIPGDSITLYWSVSATKDITITRFSMARSLNGVDYTTIPISPVLLANNDGKKAYRCRIASLPMRTYFRLSCLHADVVLASAVLCVDVDQPDTKAQPFIVYPNPVRDVLYLRCRHPGSYRLQVFSSDGRPVYEGNAETRQDLIIPCASWAVGTYILRATTNTVPEQRWIYRFQRE